jgi:hypothetical protein
MVGEVAQPTRGLCYQTERKLTDEAHLKTLERAGDAAGHDAGALSHATSWCPIRRPGPASPDTHAVCKRLTRRSFLMIARARGTHRSVGVTTFTSDQPREVSALTRAAFGCGDERGHAAASWSSTIGIPSRYRRRLVDGL